MKSLYIIENMAIRKPIVKEQHQIDIDSESIIDAIEAYIDLKIKQDPKNIDKKIIVEFQNELFHDDFLIIFEELVDRYEEAGWIVTKFDDDNYFILS